LFLTTKTNLNPNKSNLNNKFKITAWYLGVPIADKSVEATTIEDVGNVSESTVEVEGHSMDDIMPGTKPSPIAVVFVDIPEHTETILSSSVLLACRTANPVAECQWSWQPLPPVHLPLPDFSESPSVSTSKRDITLFYLWLFFRTNPIPDSRKNRK